MDSIEFARQILDLYTDVVQCCTINSSNRPAAGGAALSPMSSDLDEFRKSVKESQLHQVIS